MHSRFTQKHFKILSLIMLTMVLFSCKKTEYIDYEKEAANRILSFKVQGLPQGIEPSIDQEEGIVRVYIPYYSSLDYIIATVKLDEGAALFNEKGDELDLDQDLEPVAVGDTTKYTVESKDGIKKNYTVIHQLLPFTTELTAKFTGTLNAEGLIQRRVHSLITVTGNFESTSKNATFIFTNRQTGTEYRNFVSVNSVVSGNNGYTMTLNILPTALAGDYDVKVIHQGRTADLSPMRLVYGMGIHGYFNSTDGYAPGDTVVFKAIGNYAVANESMNGIFIGVERIYLKFNKQDLYQIPATFTDDFDQKAIDLRIVSQSRTEIKAIFPDAPTGIYGNLGDWSVFFPGKKVCGLGFYFDFNSETNWGKDLLLAAPSSTFTIKTK